MKKLSITEGVVLPWGVAAALSILCCYLLIDRAYLQERLASFERPHVETVASEPGAGALGGPKIAGEFSQSSVHAVENVGVAAESENCSNLKSRADVDGKMVFSSDFSQSNAVQKFSLLFFDLNLSSGEEQQLSSMLAQRERILSQPVSNPYMHADVVENNVDAQQEALTNFDNNIKALLGPSASYTFDLLKNSDSEQQQLNELTTKLEAVAPITDEQKKTLLLSKLTHKKGFEDTLSTYKSHTNNADENDRKAAFKIISESLQRYRDGYLDEVAQYVDEQQLAGLMDYEAIEFEEIEASLRIGLQLN